MEENKHWKLCKMTKWIIEIWHLNARKGKTRIIITINNILMSFYIWIYAFNPHPFEESFKPEKISYGVEMLMIHSSYMLLPNVDLSGIRFLFFRHLQHCVYKYFINVLMYARVCDSLEPRLISESLKDKKCDDKNQQNPVCVRQMSFSIWMVCIDL